MTKIRIFHKALFLLLPLFAISACSTNQATGRNQFTGLMSTSQETQIGAQEHQKILAQYGGAVKDKALRDYVTRIGEKIVPFTERQDVDYTFTLLDSPVVNAFALPGGYVYVTRGILMLANDESELAGVIGHEIGHVTARHSAERYSTSVLTSLGASILSAAIKVDGARQALGLGANLYLSSYSRSQEHEADDLGIRYLSRAGYDPQGMARFLVALEASAKLEALEAGKSAKNSGPSYLSTHPVTAERITQSVAEGRKYPQGSNQTNRVEYLKAVNGMVIGDSAEQGFVDNNKFIHPELGFTFDVPNDFKFQNTAQAVIAQSKSNSGASLIFVGGKKDVSQSAEDYLRQVVLKGNMDGTRDFGTNIVNGFKTASVEKTGSLNGKAANMRIVVFEYAPKSVYVFTIAMPRGTSATDITKMQNSVFSFSRISNAERNKYRPKQLGIRVAKYNDTAESMSKNFPYNDGLNALRFRTINGLNGNEGLRQGQAYKIIRQ